MARLDAELFPLICAIVIDEMITPCATKTLDNASIAPAIQSTTTWVNIGPLQTRLLKDSLTLAFQHAASKGIEHIDIKIGTLHMHFDNSVGPLNFLDRRKITTTAPMAPPPPAPPAAIAATDIVTAVALAGPPAFAAADLASAFTTACPALTAMRGSTAATTPAATGPTRSSMATVVWTFNPVTPPADIRNRHENKVDGGPILGSTISARHAGGHMCHVDANKTTLSDGAAWLHQPPSEKRLMKAAVHCEDDAHASARAWCANFMQVCHDHGFHAHPLWAFRCDHGGDCGFAVGNDPDDDLPQRMAILLQQMLHPIFCILSMKEMFPKNSQLSGIVRWGRLSCTRSCDFQITSSIP